MELPLQGRCREFESLNAHSSETLDYRRGFLFLYKSAILIIYNHCMTFIVKNWTHFVGHIPNSNSLTQRKRGGIPRVMGGWVVQIRGTHIVR